MAGKNARESLVWVCDASGKVCGTARHILCNARDKGHEQTTVFLFTALHLGGSKSAHLVRALIPAKAALLQHHVPRGRPARSNKPPCVPRLLGEPYAKQRQTSPTPQLSNLPGQIQFPILLRDYPCPHGLCQTGLPQRPPRRCRLLPQGEVPVYQSNRRWQRATACPAGHP